MKGDLIHSFRYRTNKWIGAAQSRRALAKSVNDRTLVLADNWDGSVQQFYHFFFGYYIPLNLWLDKTKASKIALRDCGPMNPWLELLLDKTDIEVIPPGTALHVVIGKRMKLAVLAGMDNPQNFNRRNLIAGATSVRNRIELPLIRGGINERILIIDRATSERFYHEHGSETHMSGKERRHVPNLGQVKEAIDSERSVEIIDFAQLTPQEQIRKAESATVLIGQHGAGLAHMIWLAPGSHVVEIAPPLPTQVQDIFQKLAITLGHTYQRVRQESVHATVEIDLLASALDNRP